MDTSEKLLSRSKEDASCVPLNVTAFPRSSPRPTSRISILFASRAASSNGTNSVSGSPMFGYRAFAGNLRSQCPPSLPSRFDRSEQLVSLGPKLLIPVSPFLFLVPFARPCPKSGREFPPSRGGFRCSPRLQADGPKHCCFEVETKDKTRDNSAVTECRS
jgi:hypothetical protein